MTGVLNDVRTDEVEPGLTDAEIARVCHEANRAYCEVSGDFAQLSWDAAPEELRVSAVEGVRFARLNPDAGPREQHAAWARGREAEGWAYGIVKDPSARTHPALLPYDELPAQQRRKDALFLSVVRALL